MEIKTSVIFVKFSRASFAVPAMAMRVRQADGVRSVDESLAMIASQMVNSLTKIF